LRSLLACLSIPAGGPGVTGGKGDRIRVALGFVRVEEQDPR
jgi:hypothetical protein